MLRRPSVDLDDAVVVVVGASSGAGRATASAFAAHGARLVLAGRSALALRAAAGECERGGAGGVLVVPVDIGDLDGPDRLARAAVDRFGRIDVWVQAAASVLAGPLPESPAEELERMVRTDVGGSLMGARAALTVFERQGRGTLITVASLLGRLPNPVVPSYVMAKFAVRGLSLSLREATRHLPGVEVCLVVPGPIDTPLFQRTANHTGWQVAAIPPSISPHRVAATVVACARRPRREITAGLLPRALRLGHRLFPGPAELLVARYSARAIVRRRATPPSAGALLAPAPGEGAVSGGWRRGRIRTALGDRWGLALAHR